MWDASLLLTAPLRALLDQCCALFPAFPRPLLRLLAALAAGPRGAGEAYAYLAREPVLTVLHATVGPAPAALHWLRGECWPCWPRWSRCTG